VITIRNYTEKDAGSVGRLIAETYSIFNLSFVPAEELGQFLGPFQFARSHETAHQAAIAKVIQSEMVFVAEEDGRIVGVLRGRRVRLGSLFVCGDCHRQGIGRKLVERFEQACLLQGPTVIRVAATLYGIPFYLAMGYKRSTGLRTGWSFDGHGLTIQPMRKVLDLGKSTRSQTD
jgi:GNAT superfamily N-acetyltransferase